MSPCPTYEGECPEEEMEEGDDRMPDPPAVHHHSSSTVVTETTRSPNPWHRLEARRVVQEAAGIRHHEASPWGSLRKLHVRKTGGR